MSNEKICEILGLNKSYISTLKAHSRKKHDYIFTFHADKKKSIELYVEHVEEIIVKMENILSKYSTKKIEYFKIVFDLGLTSNCSNKFVFFKNEEQKVYRLRDFNDFLSTPYNTVLKWEKITDYCEKRELVA